MASTRRVRTPVAGPDYTPLQALPLGGAVAVLEATSGAAVSHVVAADTSAVQIHPSADIYVAPGANADATCWLLRGGCYGTYGVESGSTVSVRAVTGAATVRILEA